MTAREYKVWDARESEQFHSVHWAMSPEHAAEMYAEEDVDGTIDRSYDAPGHEILVRDPEGILYTVRVTVEYEASFTGELVTAATE